MNEYYNVKRLALVLAVQAEIEGMKAENDACRVYGVPPAFGNLEFKTKSADLQNLAYAHDEQL
jgi:hypothetical protein